MYISRTFKKGERNKAIIEKELLAIHFALTVLRPYLYGTKFEVFSDHKPLIYLYKLKNPSSKLTRIRLDLEEYNYTITHIPGKQNVVADALSRIDIEDIKNMYNYEILAITRSMAPKEKQNETKTESTQENDDDVEKLRVHEEINAGLLHRIIHAKLTRLTSVKNKLTSMTVSVYKNHHKLFDCTLVAAKNETVTISHMISKLDAMASAYQISKIQWPLYDKMFNFCKVNEFKQSCTENLKNIEIILINRPQRITCAEEKLRILNKYHNDKLFGGHCGQKRLYAKIRSLFYWPRMTKDVAKFVRNCHICKVTKPGIKTKEPLKITETPVKPFDIIQVDTIGPMPKSQNGYQYAVTLVDELSKYLVLIPIFDKSAKTIARAIFEKFVLQYGPIKTLKSDRGTEYINEILNELCSWLNIERKCSTAYRHETVGTVEHSHRLLNEYMRAYLNGNMSEWDVHADYFTFCYNTTPNASNECKFSPFELIFGKKVNMETHIKFRQY